MEAEPLSFPGPQHSVDAGLHIDCDRCTARGAACAECVVTVLLGPPPDVLDTTAQRALEVLAGSGMVPPLRLAVPVDGPAGAPGG